MPDINDTLLLNIAISKAKGVHAGTLRELMERVGTVKNLFTLSKAELSNLTGINTDLFSDSYRQSLLAEAEKEACFVRQNHIDAMFLDSDDYPTRLSNCEDAPTMLYKLGSCDTDSRYMIGIVGTRHATRYGADFARQLVKDLAAKLDRPVIVSGLAYGIDVAAHRAAIEAGVPTIGVLAHALNTIYPADHRSVAAKMTSCGGALITEYPTSARIYRGNFLSRNRIVAGLCDCLVVVESDYKGGSMSTARIAMQYNRDVFAVPGRVTDRYSQGTNKLIANHTAMLLQDADQLIEQMGWADETKVPEAPTLFRSLTSEEEQIIEFITANPDVTVNDICVRMNKSYAALSDILFQLEMDDLVSTLPGGRIEVTGLNN
ncbi:MAG: DNA-processing protein DprA [Muribaculaceae bacterium]|nr:DNA-processing protein DprA [Muribaculaceae bacterium]